MSDKPVLLIDGDIFAYKLSCVHEKVVDLGDDIVNISADLHEIESSLTDAIGGVAEKLKADRIIVALTGDTNFRKTLYADYKANRKSVRKPVGLRHAKQFIASKWSTRVKEGIEADDTIGILLTHPTLVKGKRIAVSTDKDLLQLPGRHYNPDKEMKMMVSPEQGDQRFFMQALTGDSTDNYPGCKGIGPKTAAVLLDNPDKDNMPRTVGELWFRVREAYTKAGFDEAFALTQARLARILRHTDYDFKKKEPILWTP